MKPLPHALAVSLRLVNALAIMTLVRSLLFERWTTVVTATLLLIGANAALRARTWGIGLVLATATAFPGAVLLGIAPAWFWVVGVAGVVPFALTLRPMARFDAGATALFALLATGGGVAAAFAWREAALAIFTALHAHGTMLHAHGICH
jgi:hypothetical protein